MKNFTLKNAAKNAVFKSVSGFLISAITLASISVKRIHAEGSPQFKPDTAKVSNLMIMNTLSPYGSFACFGASDTDKLYIRITDPATEKIYLGIGQRSTGTDWYYRIKSPNGTIIAGPTLLPSSTGQGFISYHKQAINGPNVINAQGYNGFVATPSAGVAGNYYIEFNKGSGTTVSTNNELSLGIFDITVVKTTTNTIIPGRVFSYNWSFNTESYSNPFYGSFYIYGSDSSVTKVDLNGIKPYKFRASCNSWGATSTGNSANDRKSRTGFFVPPELKLFLRDPDLTAFPSGSLVFLNSPITLSRCVKDSVTINVNLTKKSDVTILIDRNGNGVFNAGTADRKLFYPGVPQGQNNLNWDGKDGLGVYVPIGTTISAVVSVESGEVDFPMFDVENHENGFSMSVIRPGVGLFVDSLYYDDQLVGGSTNLGGCAFPCHTWASNPSNSATNTIGENNTINTWWFAHKQSVTSNLVIPDYLITNAGPDQTRCVSGSDTVQLAGSIVFSTSSYSGSKKWTTSGTGQFTPNDSSYNSKYIPSAGDISSGNVLLFLAPRINCLNPVDTVAIQLKKSPQLSAAITPVNCYGAATGAITMTVTNSTSPYTFNWSPAGTTQNNTNATAGTYTVTVTSANSCTASTSATVTQPPSALNGSTGTITPVSCYGGNNGTINLNASGGTPPYTYNWNNGTTLQNLASVQAGNYTATITDSKGCTKTVSAIAVTGPAAALSSGASATGNVSCNGGSNGTINLTVTGGTSPFTFLWSNNKSTQNISGLTAGAYTVTTTDANGCTTITSAISISQPPAALTSSLSSTSAVSCFGGNNGAIDLSVSGGTAPYVYTWSNGSTMQDQSNITSGTYTVTVTDSKGCTTVSSGITISQPPSALTASVNTITPVSCFGGSSGSVNLNTGGGTAPFSYSWSNGSTTQNLVNVQAGNYTVTVSDNKGCTTAVAAIAVSEPPVALNATISSTTDVSCNGGHNAAIAISVSGGTSPYLFNWSNAATTQNILNIGAGNYAVTITDNRGCTKQVTGITVSQPPAVLSASPSSTTNVSCYGNASGDIILSVSGGTSPYNYIWSNGANSKDLNNVTAGTYTVTVTDSKGCSVLSSALTITQPASALNGTASTTANVSCSSGANGAISLTANGGTPGYSYLWNNGTTTQNISGLYAGNYVVTITDSKGCTTNASSTISQPAGSLNSTISTTQHVSCTNGSNGSINVTVTGGTLPYTYQWNTGATIQDISNLYSGNYTVTITDKNGCINNSSAAVNQPVAVLSTTISAQSAVSCFGGTNGSVDLTINGGTTPYTYLWNTGSTSQDQSGLTSGNYTVTITDANGCTVSNSAITISQPPAALNGTVNAVTNASCYSSINGAIFILPSGGTSPYSYDWSTGASTQGISNLSAGAYSVTITDAKGCTKSLNSIAVSQPANPLSNTVTSSTPVSCFGENTGTINLATTGGTSPYTYLWNNGKSSQSIANLTAGSYTATVTDANGCTDVASGIAVTQPAASLSSAISSTTNVSCYSGSTGTLQLNVNGGTQPYSFNWSNAATTQNVSGLTAGNYTVTITDSKGCTTIEQGITVGQPSAPLQSTVSSTTPVNCFGGSTGAINLSVNGGTSPYSYNWSNGATTQNLSVISSGIYTVTVTDSKGCTTLSAGNTVSQPPAALSASVNTVTPVSCFGGSSGSVSLTATGGTTPFSYNWSNGATTQNISNLQTGNYSVSITDSKGCTVSISAITIAQPPAALQAMVASATDVSCFGGNNAAINMTISGGTFPYVFAWSNGAATQNINSVNAGTYTVTVTDTKGCTKIVSGIAILQPPAALAASPGSTTNVSCYGNASGDIILSVSGGTFPYNYIWSNGANSKDLNNVISGTYTVTVTDSKGCSVLSSAIAISQPAGPLNGNAGTTANVSCSAGANGAVSLAVNGGTTGYSYLWNTGATTQNISGLYAGNYIVTITDAKGCTTNASSVVSQPEGSLNSTITTTQQVSCWNGNNGTIDLTVSGGTVPYTYQWSNGATSEDISTLSSGGYTVTITDKNGCINISSTAVNQPVAVLSTTISAQSAVSCFGGSNGSVDLTINGGTTPYTYLWNTGSTSQDQPALTAGNYSVTITDANGCTVSNSTITVSQPPAALNGIVNSVTNASCYSSINGAISILPSGGTSPYFYNWSTGASTQGISNLSAGAYSVTITDAKGCIKSLTSIAVTQPVNPLSTSVNSSTAVSCFGGNTGDINLVTAGGTSPYTYLWNNGGSSQSLSNLSAGLYTATVTDANGCTAIAAAIAITQPGASLTSTISATTNVSCYSGSNGTLQLSVNGGTQPYSFNWSNAATTQNLSGISAGLYDVTITDSKGCTITKQGITVAQPPAPLQATVSSTTPVNCFGGSTGAINLSVNGGTSPYSYNWSNGATTQNTLALASGTYTANVTDVNGCSIQTPEIIVSQPAVSLTVSIQATTQVSCFGGNNGAVNLNTMGGTSPYTYSWNTGAQTQNISNLQAGTYSVSITDQNGCTTSVSAVSIDEPAAGLSATVAATDAVSCFGGTNGAIQLSVIGGTWPYLYTWSNGATTSQITNLLSGTYSASITDAHGCTDQVNGVTVSQPPSALAANASSITPVSCFGNSTGSIVLAVGGGTSPYTYLWSNGDFSRDLNGIASGSYVVTVTDENGCTLQTPAIAISQPSAVLSGNATTTANVSCSSGANGSISLFVNGGTPGYSYLWSNGTTAQNITALYAGQYNVTITDQNGCTTTASSIVSQPAGSLNSTINTTQQVNCFGGNNGSVNLTVAGGTPPYLYQWSNGATTEDLNNLASGSYTVIINDNNGCINISAASVNQPVAILNTAITAQSAVSCFGGNNGSIDLTVTGGTAPYSIMWSNGSQSEDQTGLLAGNYSVLITDANGCKTADSSLTISQPPAALNGSVSATGNVSCFSGSNGSLTLNTSGGTLPYSYNWSNGETTQNITNLSSGSYAVTISDLNGCTQNLPGLIIQQPANPLTAYASGVTAVSCFGGNTGAILLNSTGGTAPYTYYWNTGTTTANISNLLTGTYTVTVTDMNGCTEKTAGISITQPGASLSSLVSSVANVSCNGGTNGVLQLIVSGGTQPYTFKWSNTATTQNITNLTAGQYSVTITDALGCITVNNGISIEEPPAVLAGNVVSSTPVLCYGGNNATITLAVNGGTTPYNFAWSTGATMQSLSSLSSGTYTVQITDGHNCTASVSGIAINQPAASLTSSALTSSNVNCNGGNNGAINLQVNGGTMPYSFNWSNGDTNQNLTNVVAGSYHVNITDINGCTSSVAGIVINQPPAALHANVLANQAVSCWGSNNGSLTLNVTGGTAPYLYNWSNGSLSQNLTNVASGIYSVTVTDSKGCNFNIPAQTISQPPVALTGTVQSANAVACFGNSTGNINLSVNGGTAPYTFSWNTGAITQNISNLSTGNYSVTITDANGCTEAIPSILISQPLSPINGSAVTTQNVSCNSGANGTVQLTLTGGTAPYQYLWSTGAVTQNISGLNSGTYVVNVTDSNGCTFNTSALVLQPPGALSSTIGVNQAVDCFGNSNGSVALSASGGTTPYSYNWSNGATTQNITGLSAGLYSTTITDANGCINVASVQVPQPLAVLSGGITGISDIHCYGGNNGQISLSVNGGTSPYQFLWNTGAVSQNLSGQPSGTYTVTVTDNNGCTSSIPGIVISQPQAALNGTASSTGAVSCFGGNNGTISLAVNGGTTPYQYLWSNGANMDSISNLVAGSYDVTVTDLNGCTTQINSITVSQPPAALAATADTVAAVSCFGGTNGAINLAITGGTLPYSYLWSNGSSTQNISSLLPGNYDVTITDANGCNTSVSGISITQPPAVLATNIVIVQQVDCYTGSNGSVDLTVSGGTPGYSFNWSNGATIEDQNNLGAGMYTVTVTDLNGCTQTGFARIFQPDTAISSIISVQHHVACYGGQNGEALYSVIGGSPPYTYQWSNGTTTRLNANIPAGTYVVTVVDSKGCSMMDSVVVTQPLASLNASITTLQNVACYGGATGMIDLRANDGTPPYTFTWSNGQSTEDLNGIISGIYQVLVTDANGCKYSLSATVDQPQSPLQAVVSNNQSISCFGNNDGAIDLTASNGTPPYSYLWNTGNTSEDLNNLVSGTYTVTVTDANGCTALKVVAINSPLATLAVNGNATTANCLNGITGSISTVLNGGTAPFTYLWNTGASSPNLTNLNTGVYTVLITDAKGCTTSGQFDIKDNSVFTATGPSDICIGDLATLKADSVSGVQYQWYLNGQPLNTNCTTTYITPVSGSYTVSVTNACGTFTSAPVNLKVHQVGDIATSSNKIICPGESAQLQVMGGISYQWSPPQGLNYTTISNPVANPLQSTTYTVTVTGDFGCQKTATIEIGVFCDSLKVPTGFSPNSDGVNDGFVIVGIDKYPGNKIWIYNRWGNLIYKQHDYANTWDGTSNVSGLYIGKKVPAGTYFFILDLNNDTKPLQGYIVMRY